MTKASRLTLIRQRFYALGMRASLAAVPMLATSLRSEVATTIHSYSDRTRTDDSVLDEGVEVDSLSRVELALETAPTGWHHEGESILSPAERARLAREVAPIKALKRAVAAVPLALLA